MNGKLTEKAALTLTFFALILPAFSVPGSADEFNEFPFHQEISIPASDDMLCQPVDMSVHFSHPCWAENEKRNSIRVVYDDGSEKREIESQVYNFHYTGNSYIDSCNVVFLVQGKGKYYVYYSDRETEAAQYTDHVKVSDDSYLYEPIPGYRISLNYYRIEQDGYSIYGIGQEGSFFGIDMSQKVIKQLDGKKEFKAFNWGQLASFAMFWYGGKDEGTDEKLVSKKIIVDGNLMVRVGITSTSSDKKMETSAVYTYYYSPSKEKRIIASVKHEAMEECKIKGMEEDDGLYAYLLTVRCRSSTIPDLNLGYIPPYLHINAEDGTIHEYNLDQNPSNTDYRWLISAKDDIDLGDNPWFSIDDGEKGKAYALIFKNNTVSSYESGIQVAATEKQEINVPGLEVDGGGISAGRNSYEAGAHNLVIPKGFTAKFTSEFFSSPDGGLPAVEKEADAFHKLIPYRDCGGANNGGKGGENGERYSLTVFPHLAPSFPFAPAISVVTGRRLPDVRVELWRNDTMVSSAVCSRIPFIVIDGKVRFDWKNATLMKKAVFIDVKPGEYMVKVFRRDKYVGAKPVYVDRDMAVHVICGFEGNVRLRISDQNGNEISNADIFLQKNGKIYSFNSTGIDGRAVVRAPSPSAYALKVCYKGFVVYEENVSLPAFAERKVQVELSDLDVYVADALNLPPGVAISPVLTSSEMEKPANIYGEEVSPGQYSFKDLPSASYTLYLRYKSFSVSREVSIPDERYVHVTFPAVYLLKVKPLNSRGMKIEGVDIEIRREGKIIKNNEVPPGKYDVVLKEGGKIIGRREVFVTQDTELSMVTSKGVIFPEIFSAIIIAVAALIIFFKKRSVRRIFIISSAALLLMSTLYPWWHMEGNGNMHVSTKVYLVPAKMVTVGAADNFLNGEVASMPSLFSTMIFVVMAMLLLSAVAIAAFLILQKKVIFVAAMAFSISSILIFSYGMSQVTDATTGSFWGSGMINITLPGMSEELHCVWSPSVGYYMAILAVILLLIPAILDARMKFFRKMEGN